MVWVGRDLKGHFIPTPLHGQGHLPLDQVAQSLVQPGLEKRLTETKNGDKIFAVSLLP